MLETKRHVENINIAKFEAPIIKEWDFIMVWIFKRIRGFVRKTTFSIEQHFLKFKRSHKLTLWFQGHQTWSLWYFRCALSISSIVQVLAHNMKTFLEKFGHVSPAAKSLLSQNWTCLTVSAIWKSFKILRVV